MECKKYFFYENTIDSPDPDGVCPIDIRHKTKDYVIVYINIVKAITDLSINP